MGYLLGNNSTADFIIPPKQFYINFNNIKLNKKYKFISIGDSFSQQEDLGYQNFLSQMEGNPVVHLNTPKKSSPIDYLYQLIQGDIFDSLSVDYVILQSVERSILNRASAIKPNTHIDLEQARRLDSLTRKIRVEAEDLAKENEGYFFSDQLIKFPLYNLLFLFDDNAYMSKVYKVNITRSLFSEKPNRLLFLEEDLKSVPSNNKKDNACIINNRLNDLALELGKRDIKLIVIVSPDKYSLYYNFIEDKQHYPKPIFHENFKAFEKKYIYVNAYEILRERMNLDINLYYYGDSHWSPVAAREVASAISLHAID
jgi:hypothetical protein